MKNKIDIFDADQAHTALGRKLRSKIVCHNPKANEAQKLDIELMMSLHS